MIVAETAILLCSTSKMQYLNLYVMCESIQMKVNVTWIQR